MITRATSAEFINSVVNHPDVRPFIHAPPGDIDLSAAAADPNNLVLVGEHGGMLFIQKVAGLFEIHTQFLKSGRGDWGLKFAHEAVRWLFTRTNATEVFTRVTLGNVAAAALARACGAKPEQQARIEYPDGAFATEFFGGRIQDWLRIAPGLIELGQDFHRRLHEKCAAAGIEVDHHAQNDWHDRNVGAAAAMITGGQPIKGVMFYNRWAAMALARPMTIISAEPLVLDIGDCYLIVQGDDFQVSPCQPVS